MDYIGIKSANLARPVTTLIAAYVLALELANVISAIPMLIQLLKILVISAELHNRLGTGLNVQLLINANVNNII